MTKLRGLRLNRARIQILIYVAIVVGIACFAYFIVLPRWIAFGFIFYFGIGALMAVTRAIVAVRPTRPKTKKVVWSEKVATELFEEHRRKTSSWFVRVKETFRSELYFFSFCVSSWPVLFVLPAPRREAMSGFTRSSNKSPVSDWCPFLYSSLWNLTLMVVLASFRLAGSHGRGYGRLAISIIVASTLLAMASFAIDNESYLADVRRHILNPWVSFLIMSAATLLTLALGFMLLSNPNMSIGSAGGALLASIGTLLKFRSITEAIKGTPLSTLRGAQACAGILFYIAQARHVFKYRDFKRKDDDHIHLANADIFIARFGKALNRLERVQRKESELFAIVECLALVGILKFDLASQRFRLRWGALCGRPITLDEVFLRFIGAIVIDSVPDNALIGWVRFCIQNGISDASMVNLALMLPDVSRSDQFKKDIRLSIEAMRLQFPLSAASLLEQEGDGGRQRAAEHLARFSPAGGVNEVMRWILWLNYSTSSDYSTFSAEDSLTVQHWMRDRFPVVAQEVTALQDLHELCLVFKWLCQLAVALEGCAQMGVSEVLGVAAEVKSKVSGDRYVERELAECAQIGAWAVSKNGVALPKFNAFISTLVSGDADDA